MNKIVTLRFTAILISLILVVSIPALLACEDSNDSNGDSNGSNGSLPVVNFESATRDNGTVELSVEVHNFQVVDKLGEEPVEGEGHLHFYIDVEPPTEPGEPAVTAAGSYMVATDTSVTWEDVEPGEHTFYVQLVNNDHTPLEPPVTAQQNVGETSNGGEPVTVDLTADNLAFDKNSITVPAGSQVTINFDNLENVPHNFALYETSSATGSIFVGEVITNETITYEFTAPSEPGTYFFRCDVHPLTMTGDFIVE